MTMKKYTALRSSGIFMIPIQLNNTYGLESQLLYTDPPLHILKVQLFEKILVPDKRVSLIGLQTSRRSLKVNNSNDVEPSVDAQDWWKIHTEDLPHWSMWFWFNQVWQLLKVFSLLQTLSLIDNLLHLKTIL